MNRPVEDLFGQAVEIQSPAEREAFLARACETDKALREELESLLRAHDNAGTFLLNATETSIVASGAVAPPRIPGFRIERKLGEGGLGTVYEAWDEKLHRKVALKILRRLPGIETQRALLDEARKAAALDDPAIVTIHAVLDEQEPPAIVMELVQGFRIDQFSDSLTFQQKARVLQEIARGLAVAHGHGIIHRDLKPGNVLLTPGLKPVILDFGLALSAQEASEPRENFEGTPLYASPEQVAGQPLSAASDVFSFGSLMFKVLTGRAPFDASDLQELLRSIAQPTPPFLRDVAVGVPEDLQAICLACLAADPKERPTAAAVALELGRFLAGEPVRVRPALYGDILRKRISEHSNDLQNWEYQGMISADERDRLQAVHRRILADEDHWIIDARRLTIAQSVLYTSTWIVVVAVGLLTWLVRDELSSVLRWTLPLAGTGVLLAAGLFAERRKEALAAASFLAGAVLSVAPAVLSFLAELRLLGAPAPEVKQLFEGVFTNQQVLASCVIALALSALALARLRMTGFAWTTCLLGTLSFLGVLLQWNWLAKDPEVQALWTLPLLAFSPLALRFEKVGRPRWALPFHLLTLVVLIGALDWMAAYGPTLAMVGANEKLSLYLDETRQKYFSFALNGLLFLALMFLTEKSKSLDLRRGSRVLELMAMVHLLGPLYANAHEHRESARLLLDVAIYIGSVLLLLGLGPWRSRWRLLLGGMGGVALGSYLLIDLNLVPRKAFVLGLGLVGLAIALVAYFYLRFAPRAKETPRQENQSAS